MRHVHTTTPAANQMLLEGALALSEIEQTGWRIDKGYLDATILEVENRIKEVDQSIRNDPSFVKWRSRYGTNANVASANQIAKLVFGDLGYVCSVRTDRGDRESASKKAMEDIDLPIVKNYLLGNKLRKLHGTYLMGIRREMVEHHGIWLVHPNFNLNTVVTFRSSANAPNVQNMYKREPEYANTLRRCFIPRPGQQFVETDLASAEVKMAANYTLDPVAIKECLDPKADPHKDTASKLFCLTREEVSKMARFHAKNSFVFAQFYGDYYVNCARNLWSAIQDLTVNNSDETILQRLATNGITKLGEAPEEGEPEPGTFMAQVRKVEKWYWERKYKVHTQWKRDWYANYKNDGGIMMKTGFAVNGSYSKNDIINYPIQGSSFHQLLWSLPKINAAFRKFKMKSRVIGEVHDSVDVDAPPQERDDVIDIIRKVMTKDLVKAWPWLVVPPVIEAECCPVDCPFADLVGLKEELDGSWVPADMAKWKVKFGNWVLKS